MAGRWVSGSVAGQSLTDAGGGSCRIETQDAEALKATVVGSTKTALDFSIHTQISIRGHKGIHFGIRILQIPIGKLNAVLAAMQAAVLNGVNFPVILADAGAGADKLHDISVQARPDFDAMGGRLYTGGSLSSDYAKDVVIRFITAS